jgi:hypothetical protein
VVGVVVDDGEVVLRREREQAQHRLAPVDDAGRVVGRVEDEQEAAAVEPEDLGEGAQQVPALLEVAEQRVRVGLVPVVERQPHGPALRVVPLGRRHELLEERVAELHRGGCSVAP